MPGMDVNPLPGIFEDTIHVHGANGKPFYEQVLPLYRAAGVQSGPGRAHFFSGLHGFGLVGGFAVCTLFGRHSWLCHGVARLNTARRLGVANHGVGTIPFRSHRALASPCGRPAARGGAVAC